MSYLTTPNLPKGRVTSAFIDPRMSAACRRSLEERGVRPIPLAGSAKLAYPVSSHPDMLCTHIGGKTWVFNHEIYEKNKLAVDCAFLEVKLCREPLSGAYPLNVLYNICVVGKTALCRETSASALAQACLAGAGIPTTNCRQGYAKCSAAVVDVGAIITSDVSVAESAARAGLEALMISPGSIRLEGYDYGFIGGCSGKISPDTLAFSGNIEAHPDYKKIAAFLKRRGVRALSLSDEPLTDWGGILPITEEL